MNCQHIIKMIVYDKAHKIIIMLEWSCKEINSCMTIFYVKERLSYEGNHY